MKRREDHGKKRTIGLFLLYSLAVVLLAFGGGYAINTHKWKPIHDNLRQKIEQKEKTEKLSSQKEKAAGSLDLENRIKVDFAKVM